MKSFILCIGLLLLICQSSEAQYQRMRKGDVSIYGESVNIELSTYRAIRTRTAAADTLIESQEQENKKQAAVIDEQAKTISLQAHIINRQDTTILRKDQVIQDLNKNFTTVTDAVTDKKNWLEKILSSPWTYFTGGVLSGIAIKSL
jgi:hypothetical protein